MLLAAFTYRDAVDIALAVFLVAAGLGLLYALVWLGVTFGRLSSFIRSAQDEIVPILNKVGGTVDRVNGQLDKVDQMTDSAVDAVDSVDTAVRALSLAVTRPVQKLAGLAAGLSHGAAHLKAQRDLGGAVRAAKEAAARRERDLAEELRRTRDEGA